MKHSKIRNLAATTIKKVKNSFHVRYIIKGFTLNKRTEAERLYSR